MKAKISIILLALLTVAFLAVAPAAADLQTVPTGGVVFVGEEGLIFTALPAGGAVEWFAPGDTPGIGGSAASAEYTVVATKDNAIDPATFQTRTGNWYLKGTATVAFNVQMPSIDVKIYNAKDGKDMTNQRLVKDDTYMAFRLDSNLYQIVNTGSASYRGPFGAADLSAIKIVVVDAEGTTYTALYNNAAPTVTPTSLVDLLPDLSQYFVPGAAVAAGDKQQSNWYLDRDDYKSGVYTFYGEVNLNGAKDNVGTVTGVTKSAEKTIELGKDDVKIESNKDTVVRNNDFAVTITGRPNTDYVLWVKGTSTIGGLLSTDIVPFVKANQNGVVINAPANPKWVNAGNYRFTGVVAPTTVIVSNDVCLTPVPASGAYYAMVTLSDSGTRTVGFGTNADTVDQTYTIRADLYQDGTPAGAAFSPTYDTVKVKVEKGGITVTASGDSSYYIGEEIILSGTNTDSPDTWLFITGPNLKSKGAPITNPKDGVMTGGTLDSAPATAGSWAPVTVETDDTWEYKWNTGQVNLDAGTYTIYAVTTPTNKDDFGANSAIYKTASVVIKKPFVTATSSSLTVARGDDLYIKGTAEGDPTPGIAIWILGKNYVDRQTETVEDDGSFEYKFSGTDTLAAGQYFVVVQHPMENDRFDLIVTPTGGSDIVQKLTGPSGLVTNLFALDGPGSLQGSEAATALVNAMNSPDIDDTYYKLTFMVEEPWIVINAIGDKHVGDSFTITGTTNLAVGDQLIVEAQSASFKPTDKTQSSGFVGATGTVSVTAGDKDGVNVWEFTVDTASFIPDQYIVTVEAIEASLVGTQTFNVMKAEPTTKPTAPVDTPVATVTPVKTAEPTPEQTAPGFGVLVALIGLGAVAALIVRRD